MEKTKGFHMRASEEWLGQLRAASDALKLGKTELVEAALVAFAPEYFAAQGPEDSSGLRCAKYAPQLFERPEGEKKLRSRGGQPSTKAKRSGAAGEAVAKNNSERSGE